MPYPLLSLSVSGAPRDGPAIHEGLARLRIGCPAGKRPRRGDRPGANQPGPPNLSAVETDTEGRVVYVDLQTAVQNESFATLTESLVSNRPSERLLSRLPPINRGRLLVEIEAETTLAHFSAWLGAALVSEATGPALRRLLAPLGPRLRLLGAQWIVPKATEYEPKIAAQTPHTDVDAKGEVVSIALNVAGNEMGTLIDAKARIGGDGSVVDGCGFGRAATPAFAYDTGAVHGGPGVARVDGPYPKYFVERAFFLLSADDLDPDRIAQHRRDNGLNGRVDLVVGVL